jgi:hypothetical protein
MPQALVVKVVLPANGGILQKGQRSHELQVCYFRRIAVTGERLHWGSFSAGTDSGRPVQQ